MGRELLAQSPRCSARDAADELGCERHDSILLPHEDRGELAAELLAVDLAPFAHRRREREARVSTAAVAFGDEGASSEALLQILERLVELDLRIRNDQTLRDFEHSYLILTTSFGDKHRTFQEVQGLSSGVLQKRFQ